jgi:chromosome segregation ATPase
VVLAMSVFLLAVAAFAQDSDSPSLGDLARQQREQHAKSTKTKDGKTPKVFTNTDLPAHTDDADQSAASSNSGKAASTVASGEPKQGSEEMKSQIQTQKSQIAELQKQIDDLNGSIRFAPGNCVRGCEQWNQHQEQKQQQVEQMQSQLAEQKKQLEEMQESARKQGFGSSVYDP